MLASLLRPKKHRRRVEEHSPFSSQYADQSSPILARHQRLETRHATADFTETELDDENTEDEEDEEDDHWEEEIEEQEEEEDEDGEEDTPLLPIFSAAHLDALPVYNLTHSIRLIVLPKTETTLTWDQLRSPQVSQFLVKPMQQQIRTSHFSRATLYALMANCLQFQKEGQANPGNAGNSRTRAMVCELLAIKLLKEYNTRELIDALSYDFYPLQGIATPMSTPGGNRSISRPAAARISTLEVAIRASAKRFLAHPVVVQQLEAIWAGTIVFHSAADNLHRPQARRNHQQETQGRSQGQHLLVPGQNAGYGTNAPLQPSPDKQARPQQQIVLTRRTVTLYDPRDASLFKLSRLRVPRYRQFFSTCSLAILLGLFVAVLAERSNQITPLEIVFWFWSAGFMLDEVVGFNEQGFSLYLMSFWNTFDLGILLLLMIYYAMRLYGIFLADAGRREWNGMAYDVLAANAILLFPRLFSVLDHYRYFSQLLIAFRLMAIDLVAVFVLILIACSGFFVAFTMSFGKGEYDGAEVAYRIFQILMGFTPAAWEAWPTYNILGKAILVLFLFICHFLVVTILITVLTNSFMAIVSNANEEHQFVFAVNTISMVKNDALFSYVAPSNIFAWLLTPLRFCLPFRVFIKLNRTVIKATHFPLLFSIFAYEKIFLAREVFEPTDLVEGHSHSRKRLVSFQEGLGIFSPGMRMRQDSVAGFQKDRALDDVFRLAPRGDTLRATRKDLDRTHNVVNNWIDHQGGEASPPQEQDRSIVDRLEMRRQARKATLMRRRALSREISGTRSVASDPAEFRSTGAFLQHSEDDLPNMDQTDADGDDELLTNDDDEGQTLDKRTATSRRSDSDKENDSGSEDYFHTPNTQRRSSSNLQSSFKPSSTTSSRKRFGTTLVVPRSSPSKRRPGNHNRNLSTNTILYNPLASHHSSSASQSRFRPENASPSKAASTSKSKPATPTSSLPKSKSKSTPRSTAPPTPRPGHRTPKHSIYTTAAAAKPRPILPNRANFQSVPNFNSALDSPRAGQGQRPIRHRRSSFETGGGMSDLGLDTAPGAGVGMVPSSFATQMHMALTSHQHQHNLALTNRTQGERERERERDAEMENERMMGRLMLARMKTLEEGFAEVVREVKRSSGLNSSVEGDRGDRGGFMRERGKDRVRGKGKQRQRKEGGIVRTRSEIDVGTLGRGAPKHGGIDILGDVAGAGGEEEEHESEGAVIERWGTKGSSL